MEQFNRKTKTSHTTTSQAAIISAAFLSSCTILSGMILSSSTTQADTVTSNATVNVNMSCTMSAAPGTGGTATSDGYLYSTTIDPGTHKEIAGSILTTSCNGTGNYSLYAIGYSGDSYDTPTNTQMIGSGTSAGTNIVTGTATSGGTSNWAFKLINSGTYSPTIISPYNNYANIPGDDFVKVANYIPGTTGSASSSSVQAKYQVYVASTQPVGTYTGKVKYTMVYPNDAPAPSTQIDLYDAVASMSKGIQTVADLRTAIDANNSGVYEYNTSVFGTASDAANTSKIYYYRGILDNTVGTYGSDGDNAAWPNTVLLDTTGNGKDTSDTCWRIVRTTGSGGVKMIYQGKWTGSTCAKSGTNANAVSDVYFNRRSTSSTNQYDTTGRIIYVGYNFSSDSSHQTGTSSVNNSTLFVNGTKSNLRTQLESWYSSNMTAWTSKLETSAGWCNDRTTYSSDTTSSKTTSNIPYKTSSATVNFGAYIRNTTTNSQPTLGCPNDTGYDLLTTSNGYIGVPSAPLTADEAAFAGSGESSSTTPYHANSFLRSGSNFLLLSPDYRSSGGYVREFSLYSDGYLASNYVSTASGVRPSISLTSGTTAASGTGTAVDPWIVNP